LKPNDPVSALHGIGPRRRQLLGVLNIKNIGDLLYHLPARYEDRRKVTSVHRLAEGKEAVLSGKIGNFSTRTARSRRLNIATFTVSDDSGEVDVVLFGGSGKFGSIHDGNSIYLYGVPFASRKNSFELKNPEYFIVGANGSLPSWLRLWPVYPTTKGLPRSWLANTIYDCVMSEELIIDDPLPPHITEKYSFPSIKDAFKNIHAPSCMEDIERSRGRLAYQDFFENQMRIAERERLRHMVQSHSMSDGETLQSRFTSALPFELTDSQREALSDIAKDMDSTVPMNRLVIGDVGSGKTAVAAAAAARCAGAGYQSAILVPTTLLAHQFFGFCEKYMSALGVSVAAISGATPRAARDELLWKLRDGEIDVLIGTHAMLSDGIAFKSLGLLVIDEQQRFGVLQRDRISSANRGVHLLMTSATPIPRTLRMAFYGDVAYTQMGTRPGKGKTVTRVMSDNHIGELYNFLEHRIKTTSERCYWVCPTIGGGELTDGDSSVMNRLRDIKLNVRDISVEALTGTMTEAEKSARMERFAASPGILVSTTVIEVGVDVGGANIIIIESASSFGLSQLHQMRGRVGRGERPGVCILLDSARNLKNNRRLEILLECADGFQIAEEDLKLRGAGEYLGTRQHGEESFRAADVARDEKWFLSAKRDAEEMTERPGSPQTFYATTPRLFPCRDTRIEPL
jgi:ATP-dependent DNA helicase RecG